MEEPTPSPSEPGAELFDRWLAHRDAPATAAQPRTSVEEVAEPEAELEPQPEPQPEPEQEPEPGSEPGPSERVQVATEEPEPSARGHRKGRRAGRFGRRQLEVPPAATEPELDLREFETMVQAEGGPVVLPSDMPISELDLPPMPVPLEATEAPPRRAPDPADPADPPFAELDVREFEEMVRAESRTRFADAQPDSQPEPEPDDVDQARREAEAARLAQETRLQAERDAEAARLAQETRLQAERDAEEARLQAQRDAEAARLAQETRLQAERDAEEARLQAERDAEAARLAQEARLQAERDAEEVRLAEEARLQAERDAEAARLAEEARLEAERDAEAARLAERLAEEARAGAVGSGHGVLSAFAAASASADVADLDVAEVDVTEPAPPHEEAPKRLSWSTGSPLSRLSRRRKPAEPSTPAPVDAPPAILDPAHDVLAAFAAAKPTPTRQAPAAPAPTEPPARVTLVAARTVPETPPAPQTAPEPPLDPTPAPVVRTVHAPDRPGPSRDLTFKPKRGARRLVGLLLLVALAATAYAGYLAYEAQTVESIVVAAGLGVLALALWAIRAGSSVSRLSVTNGQLEILNASGRFVFDLTSVYMPIEVVGTPGQRKWKVLFVRRSMAPFTVDSSMVDPQEFMAVLREYRPESDAS